MEQPQGIKMIRIAILGGALFIMSLLLPIVANVETLGIMPLLMQSLETLGVSYLLDAGIRLVLMNTMRIAPAYLGALIMADLMTRKKGSFIPRKLNFTFKKWDITSFVIPVLLVPFIYMVIEALYGIHYDFRMPAFLSMATVIITLRLSRIEATQSLGKTSLVVFQLVFGFQWLDIVPALTSLGFGHGEISRDLKIVAELLGATSLFNYFGMVAAGILIVSGLISAKFIVDYHALLHLAELEKKHSVDMERMRTEAVLARSYREIQALVHDLKTPLTTIQGLASAMADFDDGTGSSVHAQRISGAAERMDTMIAEMMRESTRRNIPAEHFTKKLEAHLPEEKTQGLVTFKVEPRLPHLLVNQTRMIRAIVNLVDNAIDAGATNVQVRFTRDGDLFVIDVSDNGCGMSEAALTRWEEGGYSTKNSTGVGLMFVNQIAEEHGGILEIQSALGRGTVCSIRVPCFVGGEGNEKDLSSG